MKLFARKFIASNNCLKINGLIFMLPNYIYDGDGTKQFDQVMVSIFKIDSTVHTSC